MRTVLIFTQTLLPVSQTFVRAQASALTSFRPRHAGLEPAQPSLSISGDAIYLSQPKSVFSRLRKGLYELTGVAPTFHRLLRSAQPALVHAHFAPSGAAILPLLRQLKVPLIVTLHGYDVNIRDEHHARRLGGRLYLSHRSELWARASLFICVSNFIRQSAIARGFPEHKLRVHYIGVDRRSFAPSDTARKPIALFVGRLIQVKGCEYALRAMRHVASVMPEARLTIIGDGPLRAGLERLAQRLQINCDFLGTQSNDVVRTWMQRAKVLCAPSEAQPDGQAEGLPIALLEAQACGTPVVAFRTGGIPEAMHDGVTGHIVPSGDVEQLAAAMLRYLLDDTLWQCTSLHAAQWIADHFDLHKQTAELEQIYNDLISPTTTLAMA